MTGDELCELRSHPKSAMDVAGWLLRDFEIEAAVRFERDNPGLDVAAFEGLSPYCGMTNVW